MKMVMIAGMALLLLGGGGAGIYFFLFNKPAEASATAMSEHEQAVEQAAMDAHGNPIPDSIFVQLDPLILPIVDQNGVTQTISLVLSVEVADQAAADRVKHMQPRLKDAYIQDMYGVLSRKAAMNGGVIEVGKIKARLNAISQKVMGEGAIQDVLLQVVVQRRV